MMDKKTYLKNKLERLRDEKKHARESFCFACSRLSINCLCVSIKPFDTYVRYVLLLHPMEAKKEKVGTGKISNLSLINSEIIVGVDFTEDERVNFFIDNSEYDSYVLYPGKNALNITSDDISSLIDKKNSQRKIVIFLIDGTWPCAKKMMRLSTNLQLLPRVSFTATHTSIFEIKEQPADFCLSTLESIHFFIKECNRRGLECTHHYEDQMLVVFKEMIDFQIKCSLDPNLSSYTYGKLGYSEKGERVRAKKWLTKNIVLAD
jgi:DTW domain-containing protein YfiP